MSWTWYYEFLIRRIAVDALPLPSIVRAVPMRLIRVPALIVVLMAWCPSARAHFNMLLPQSASVKRGEAVTFVYQWGHPFEHQLFDAPAPTSLVVWSPDGARKDIGGTLEKCTLPAGENRSVAAYRFRFVPETRGDYCFVLETPPIWMREDEEFLQDRVKVILHVLSQNGWDRPAGPEIDVLPMTRPYGLQPGMAFQARVQADGKPLAGAIVEVEHYHAAPPKRLPPDEHITRTVKTDANGGFVGTLTEPGWWCLTASRTRQRERDGKLYPLRQRAILWVFVDGAIVFRETK